MNTKFFGLYSNPATILHFTLCPFRQASRYGQKAATATISHIITPSKNLLTVPAKTPNPAPMPDRTDSSAFLPDRRSTDNVAKAAPAQAPIKVPRNGIGITNVPTIAPVTAPRIAAAAAGKVAPAVLAPVIPAKNSTSSPNNASAVIITNVYIEKTPSSARHHAKRAVEITTSQLPGR